MYTKTTISGIDLHWNYQKHFTSTKILTINKYQTIVVSKEYCLIQVPNCPVPRCPGQYRNVQDRVPRCPGPSTEMSKSVPRCPGPSTEMSRSQDVQVPRCLGF